MGITFDREQHKFQFDFEHDGTSDLITLTGSGYQVEAFDKCFYYGYEFEPEIDSEIAKPILKNQYRQYLLKVIEELKYN